MNGAFHSVDPRLEFTKSAEKRGVPEDRARLAAAGTELETTQTELKDAQRELKALEPRLSFSPKLPTRCCQYILVTSEESWRACCVREARVEGGGGNSQGPGNVQNQRAIGCRGRR